MRKNKYIKIKNGKINIFDEIDGRLIDSRKPTSFVGFMQMVLDWDTKYNITTDKKKKNG